MKPFDQVGKSTLPHPSISGLQQMPIAWHSIHQDTYHKLDKNRGNQDPKSWILCQVVYIYELRDKTLFYVLPFLRYYNAFAWQIAKLKEIWTWHLHCIGVQVHFFQSYHQKRLGWESAVAEALTLSVFIKKIQGKSKWHIQARVAHFPRKRWCS